ncbi:MAG: hypothetical protein IH899_13725 [Planctomycetes bacterium]|nr:hypothetical protein [Planctomycetota bacterium]
MSLHVEYPEDLPTKRFHITTLSTVDVEWNNQDFENLTLLIQLQDLNIGGKQITDAGMCISKLQKA